MHPRVSIANCLVAALVLTCALGAKSQDTSEPRLYDEFGKTSCEDVIARQDGLFYSLSTEPGAIGYAVIIADDEHLKEAVRFESMFHGQTESRRFERSRFQIVRAKGKNFFVQLWIVPPGASLPKFEPRIRSFSLDPEQDPFMLNASEYDTGPCPVGNQFEIFAEYLNANEHARGRVMIWARTRELFTQEKERIERDLIERYELKASQVTFLFRRHKSEYTKWEYWIAPGQINEL